MSDKIKELEAEIKLLKQENELRTGWISLLTHDLKENFSSLLWLIDNVENQTISKDDFFKLLPSVKQDAQKNLQTVTSTEEWLKTQLMNFELQQEELVVHDLFSQLQEEFEDKLTRKEIDFRFKGDKTLSLQTDRFLILFIFKKILDNAIKYSHPGKSIEFTASKRKGKVILSVTDFGIGMGDDQLNMLFSFPNIITKGTHGEIGAGLSLKVVKNFVFLLLGKIEIQSDKAKGTRVSIILPKKTKNTPHEKRQSDYGCGRSRNRSHGFGTSD